MKSKSKVITLSLLAVTSLVCSQEVYAKEEQNQRSPISREHVEKANNDDDWFEEDDNPKDNLSLSDNKDQVDGDVADLFSDQSSTTKEQLIKQTEDEKKSSPQYKKEESELKDTSQESEQIEKKEESKGTSLLLDKDTNEHKDLTKLKKNQKEETVLSVKREEEVNKSIWDISDFIIQDKQIIGFSKAGVKKLRQTGQLVLPARDQEGRRIERVASFAFVPNKRTAIPDYISRPGENGKVDNLDVDKREIINQGEEFNAYAIKSLIIPEGYLYIGSDAFTENKNLSEIRLPQSLKGISDYAFAHTNLSQVDLPDSLEKIGDNAFFDNRLSKELILPKSLKELGERAFKSNRITTLLIKSPYLKVIKEAAFEDNSISHLTIESPIEKIEENAFAANPGDAHYGNFVVIKTSRKATSIGLIDKHVYVNPGEDKKTTLPAIDYSRWTVKDFTYQGTVLTGFSESGLLKIRQNKKLEIPKVNAQNLPITEIAANAFRNVDFNNKSLRKYDIEELILPSTIRKIGDFAFQSNNLTSFEANDDLEEIGQGSFMNNQIDILSLNDQLKIIGDAAFHINRIYAIIIPENVEKIGISAFRQNGATNLLFMGNKLREIGEMAFLSNALSDLDLSQLEALKTISVQAFADNLLTKLSLPKSLESISAQAFKTNLLKEVSVPKDLQTIAFNAFDHNTGHPKYQKVLVKTKSKLQPSLADGDFFRVNPEEISKDKSPITKLLKTIKDLDIEELRDSTRKQYVNLEKKAQSLLEDQSLSQGAQNKFVNETSFFLGRIDLDKALEKAIRVQKGHPHFKDSSLLEAKITEASRAYNNSALTDQRIKRLMKELEFLSQLARNNGQLANTHMAEGLYHLESSLPIPDYYIFLNLYFDDKGKIIFVLDRSAEVGQGQIDEYGNTILNIDEDNEGYHSLAIATLADYEGFSIYDILAKNIGEFPTIRVVEKANAHRQGIFQAIKNACQDAATYLEKLKKEESIKQKTQLSARRERIKNQRKLNLLQGQNADKDSFSNSRTKLPQTSEESTRHPFKALVMIVLSLLISLIARKEKKSL
ncbi:leucine-rich repeat adhesin HupY/LrrG [Streptococcus catagoni]|uniref:leucine-rich repeat adhesin HupY/LrrG n=1 Tax=Streptococcus catagoni TaxID=2654874 RepID=UPI00140C3659|nr:leucine-rich repeat domain-containing protein [Streptococcus catagoni]